MPRMSLTRSIEVDGRPEGVFAYLADIPRHIEWAGLENKIGLVEIEVEDTGTPRVGTRFRSVGREEAMTMRDESTITAFDPPHALGFETVSRLGFVTMRYRHHYALHASTTGTRVTYTVTAEPANPPAWLLLPIMRVSSGRAKRIIDQSLGRFNRACEGRPLRQVAV